MANEPKKSKNSKTLKDLDNVKEPTILIRPIGWLGGLDNIHVALIALVIILIAILLLLTYSKPFVINNQTASSCSYGSVNGTCISGPTHNASQIEGVAESILATYASVNSSLSILPFYTDVSKINASYIPSTRSWYVLIPASNPINNQSFYLSTVISDANTHQYTPFYQLPKTNVISGNKVVAPGVIQIAGKSVCLTQSPLPIYWFIDPYAPGGVSSLVKLFAIQNTYVGKINSSVKMLFGTYTTAIANQVGTANADALGEYLFCASTDPSYQKFVYALNSSFIGDYESPSTLASIAQGSGLNVTNLNSCLNGKASSAINGQALFADYYNITFTPAVITNCRYLSIPQTEDQAICYSNSLLC